jgi:hypothetical protein
MEESSSINIWIPNLDPYRRLGGRLQQLVGRGLLYICENMRESASHGMSLFPS